MQGLINPASYAPNPDGISTAFNVLMKAPAEYAASSRQNFDFFFINGVTDAPGLTITPQGSGLNLVSNIGFDSESNYVSVPSEFMTLQIQDSLGNILGGGNYFANFPAYMGQTAVLLTSGFLNPSTNQNGPPLSLYMAPVEGGPFVPLFITGIKSELENSNFTVFPNPVSSRLFVSFQTTSENINCSILDVQGRIVKQQPDVALSDLSNGIDVSDLSNGTYILQITDGEKTAYNKFIIQK
jgi:hypothetical protein